MKLNIEVNVEELLGKADKVDLAKLANMIKNFNNGQTIEFMSGNLKITRSEDG